MNLKSFIIAPAFALFCTVLYFLFVNYFIYNHPRYAYSPYYLYGILPIVVFILGILIFYAHAFLTEINKQNWLYLTVGISALVAIYYTGFLNIDIALKNALHFEILPEQYNKYQDINQPVLQFGSKEMKQAFQSDDVIQLYLNQNNELIVVTEKLEEISNSYNLRQVNTKVCKLDVNGHVIDTYSYYWNARISTPNDRYLLNLGNTYVAADEEKWMDDPDKYRETLFEGYLINSFKKYYSTWIIDGDTTKKNIEEQNATRQWNKNKQISLLNEIRSDADAFFTSGLLDHMVFYVKNNKWYVFYYDLDYDESQFRYACNEKRNFTHDSVFYHYSDAKREKLPNEPTNINPLYFHKLKLMRFFVSGKETSGISDEWQGNLYSHLVVGNDTLKFKEKLLVDTKTKPYDLEVNGKQIGTIRRYGKPSNPYLYYSNEKLSYQLFTNDEHKLYIIRTRS